MAHHLHRTGEPPAVAELGPGDHRRERTDPVVGLGQGPTRRLARGEALTLAPNGATSPSMASITRYPTSMR